MEKLDKYECALIEIFKSHFNTPITVRRLKEWIAWRCALPIEYAVLKDVADLALDLANRLNLITPNFILSLDPSENYVYTCTNRKYFKKGTKDFYRILISRLDSLFSLTNVDKLPGYREYYYQRNKIDIKPKNDLTK